MSPGAQRWQRLTRRDRFSAVVLGALGLGVLGYQGLYRPRASALAKAQAERRALQQQVQAMRNTLPDLEQERRLADHTREEVDRLRQDLARLESGMPSAEALGRVIQAMARQEQGLRVVFESIKQRLNEDAEPPEATIEIALTAPYEDAVNYLHRVERLSPFLRVAQVDIADPKGRESGASGQDVKLALVTPLRVSSLEEAVPSLAEAASVPEPLSLPRSPFASKARPLETTSRQALKVAGITWRGEDSTAIINDEVVRIGGRVGERTVSKILPDRIILSDGQEVSPAAFEP